MAGEQNLAHLDLDAHMRRYTTEIMYVATGDRYLIEAIRSAEVVRGLSNTDAITLFTDKELQLTKPFTSIKQLKNPSYSFADKISALQFPTCERCLFLDTDTYAIRNIDSVFELLNAFDIAVAHASWRFSPGLSNGETVVKNFVADEAPESFVDFNTGVILFQNTDRVSAFFECWRQVYAEQMARKEYQPANDQAAFRVALCRRANLDYSRKTSENHGYGCRNKFETWSSSL
jgi:hypothetical protein